MYDKSIRQKLHKYKTINLQYSLHDTYMILLKKMKLTLTIHPRTNLFPVYLEGS